MTDLQYLPIPPELLALASQTITGNVSRIPFARSGVMVTGELVRVTMECLNAEASHSLPITTPAGLQHPDVREGLDRVIAARITLDGKAAAPVIAEVLVSAGIAEYAEFLDKDIHRSRRSIRILAPWTWHIASQNLLTGASGNLDANGRPLLSWMALCPVCRNGALSKITGRQLFGIPHTDFFIECGSCGAKFIPVGPAFRLVSIATVRDPLWKRHLDKTHSENEWAALARGTGPGRAVPVSLPKGPDVHAGTPAPSLHPVRLKDGSFALTLQKKTWYFRPAPFTISGPVRGGLFAKLATPLQDLLDDPAFSHLKDTVMAKYPNYLPMKAGLFLSQLKERHDPFYQEFLNPYGDEKYGTIRAGESGEIGKAGILLVVAGNTVYHACACPESFRSAINERFGRITPGLCLLNGDAVRCRINAVLCAGRGEIGLYILAGPGREDQDEIIRHLAVQDSSGTPMNGR